MHEIILFGSNKHAYQQIEEHENLPAVLAAGWQVTVHGWRKNSKGKWVLRESEVCNCFALTATL